MPEQHTTGAIPTVDVIPCRQTKMHNGQVRFWCTHCNKWHAHEHDAVGIHLRAQCLDPRSPYAMTGYVLRLWT